MYSVIDIGSNTVRLAVYTYENGVLSHVFGKKYMAKLIRHVTDGKLSLKAMELLRDILLDYKSISDNMNAKSIYAFATASLRCAENCAETLEYIRKTTGIEIDVISGEEEARLNFDAVKSTFYTSTCLIADIGGGSSEIISAENGNIIQYGSLPAGSLTMYMKYVSGSVPNKNECEIIKNTILNMLAADYTKRQYHTLIGIGGSIKHFAKIIKVCGYSAKNGTLPLRDVQKLYTDFAENPTRAAEIIGSVSPDRLTTVIPGIIIADAICGYFGCNAVKVCYTGVREGYILNKLSKEVMKNAK